MQHPSELELIELVAARLPQVQRDALEAHLNVCAPCHERRRDAQFLWDQLGSLQSPVPSRNPAEAVRTALAAASTPRDAPLHTRSALRLVRIAAAIALAVGTGHLAAKLTRTSPPAPPAAAAAEALLLHEVFGNGAAGLAETLLREPEPGLPEEING